MGIMIHQQRREIRKLNIRISDEIESQKQQLKSDQYNRDVAIENEGKRIASDLHDDTVQRMVAVRFRLEQILYFAIPERAEIEIKGIRKEIDDIISTLRFLINGLTQPRFEIHPFSYIITQLAKTIGAMHHVKVVEKSIYQEQEFEIQPAVKQQLYYMVHEAAHNFLKNSTGLQLIISLTWTDELVINIEDNGQGLMRGRGYGLGMESMQKRADEIQAELIYFPGLKGLRMQVRYRNPISG